MNNVSKTKRVQNKLLIQRKMARHGDFFFAKFLTNNGIIRNSPVFVLSNPNDNKDDDIIICSCTKTPPRTEYDILYQLKLDTSIRTNKIYTIHRENLEFKIGSIDMTATIYTNIINHVKLAMSLNNEIANNVIKQIEESKEDTASTNK